MESLASSPSRSVTNDAGGASMATCPSSSGRFDVSVFFLSDVFADAFAVDASKRDDREPDRDPGETCGRERPTVTVGVRAKRVAMTSLVYLDVKSDVFIPRTGEGARARGETRPPPVPVGKIFPPRDRHRGSLPKPKGDQNRITFRILLSIKKEREAKEGVRV